MITLILVDDKPEIRRGLRMCLMLEPDFAVIGEAGDGAQALALAQLLHPDVALMDVEMPRMDGIAATAEWTARHLPGAVVILTIHDDPLTRSRAMAAGAAAFVPKGESPAALAQAIRGAAAHRQDYAGSSR